MKRNFGFIGFLTGWALFVLDLPDAAQRFGKWIPILSFASEKLTASVNALIRVLPKAPGCGTCFAFYAFWPTLSTIALVAILYILFFLAYKKVTGEPPFRDSAAKIKVSTILLFIVGQLIVTWLVQSWLLHRYSGLSLTRSLTILTFEGRVEAARDKNFFLQGSNIYGLIILVSYLAMVLLIQWAWVFYKRNPKAEAPH
jgi:hypothetical protein